MLPFTVHTKILKHMTTINQNEVNKFTAMANEWWNENGKFKPLHRFNPTRLNFITSYLAKHFCLSQNQQFPLQNIKILDIGCGGGLVAEPLARLGADVCGIDASPTNIEIAKLHLASSGLVIDYRCNSIEQLQEQKFDVVLALEVIEHIDNIELFIQSCRNLLAENGILFVATINRNLKSLLCAKFAVEYILRWLPIGTHSWHKFLKPSEINEIANKYGLKLLHLQGFSYNILNDCWKESGNIDINYCLVFA